MLNLLLSYLNSRDFYSVEPLPEITRYINKAASGTNGPLELRNRFVHNMQKWWGGDTGRFLRC